MPNMSYCVFQNTLADLKDCADALSECSSLEETFSPDEVRAAKALLSLCQKMSEYQFDDYDQLN